MSRVRLQRSEAIILRRRDYGEADRILSLYCRDRGKISAIAKGSRRITSRQGGHIELFTHAELLLARGRDLDVLTQASTLDAFRPLREDLVRATYAYHVAELLDRLIEEGEPSPSTFELLRASLDALCHAEDPSLVVRFFELRLLGLQGYRPQLFHCIRCAERLEPAGNAFSPRDGGMLCPRCAPAAEDAIPLDEPSFRVLRYLQTHDLPQVLRLELGPTTRAGLERCLHAYLRELLERNLKSVEFLQKLRRVASELSIRPGEGATTPGAADRAREEPMDETQPHERIS